MERVSKYKLIEFTQEILVECDNHKCDYSLKSPDPSKLYDLSCFVNMKCPRCGENLCTKEDYINHLKIVKAINWINKWFGWIGFFMKIKNRSNIIEKVNIQNKQGKNVIWKE